MADARLTALQGLGEVLDREGYSNLVLESLMRKSALAAQERAFCTALFYGVLERRITLDWVLGRYSRQPVAKLSPAVREILRLAVYQLLYMPSVPEAAAVNEAVRETRALRVASAAGYVNGVLRAFLREGKQIPAPRNALTALSVRYSVPEELIALWQKSYGEEKTRAILEGAGGPPPVFLRVNTTRITAAELRQRLAEEGLETAETDLPDCLRCTGAGDLTRLPSFAEGLFHVQDLSSQRCAAALAVQPGQRVLDVCAAPGGKSFTLAEEMQNRGSLLAMDLSASRLRLVEQGAERLGLGCIATRQNDAAQFEPALGVYDRVLCDVVCSGYGVIRRKPEIRYKPVAAASGLPELQLAILTASAGYLAPGGRLVYSTCTLNPAENEGVVNAFLARRPDFALCAEPATCFPAPAGGDGFFYAAMERRT